MVPWKIVLRQIQLQHGDDRMLRRLLVGVVREGAEAAAPLVVVVVGTSGQVRKISVRRHPRLASPSTRKSSKKLRSRSTMCLVMPSSRNTRFGDTQGTPPRGRTAGIRRTTVAMPALAVGVGKGTVVTISELVLAKDIMPILSSSSASSRVVMVAVAVVVGGTWMICRRNTVIGTLGANTMSLRSAGNNSSRHPSRGRRGSSSSSSRVIGKSTTRLLRSSSLIGRVG